MRNLNKNKQSLYYALYLGEVTIYRLDQYGQKIPIYTDETTTPPTVYYEEEDTRTDTYDKPVQFLGNIALTGGDSEAVDFGVSVADYEAVLITPKGLLPITETSLIWHTTEPTVDAQGYPDPATADYKIVKVSPSLNEDRYVLSKVVK